MGYSDTTFNLNTLKWDLMLYSLKKRVQLTLMRYNYGQFLSIRKIGCWILAHMYGQGFI